MNDGDAPKKRGEELMKQLTSGKVTSVTIGIGHRCPHCGELPEMFRTSFERRVEELYIVPKKSRHMTVDAKGTIIEYTPMKEDGSPSGRYPAVIVPRFLVGKVIRIDVQEAPAAASGGGAGTQREAAAPETELSGALKHSPPAVTADAPEVQSCAGCEENTYDEDSEGDCNLPEGEKCPRGLD